MPVSCSFNSTPADPCTDHLILLEHPRAGWRGVPGTICVGLALKLLVRGGCRLICVVGRHHHRGAWAAAAAASVGWICLLDACLTAGLRQDRRCLLLGFL